MHPWFQNSLSAIVGINHPLAPKEKVSLPELERYELALPSKGLQASNALDSIVSDSRKPEALYFSQICENTKLSLSLQYYYDIW